MRLTLDEMAEVDRLLDVCFEFRGEYVSPGHGSGSWATTYSNQFIDASKSIFLIYRKYYSNDKSFRLMADKFQGRNIRTCRASIMTWDKVRYLLRSHASDLLE